MGKFLQSMFTTADNTTGDLARVVWFGSHACGWVMGFLHGWGSTELLAFHSGIATAFSGSLLLKKSTEPTP